MTPGPVAAPKSSTPLVAIRASSALPDLSPDNIVQMTDNDVTVNASTGGLKFRVDPQTLSSNKMYRLPDGRIFAINANPSMPGGYSATIVAVTDNGASAKSAKGTTFAAKLSAVSAQAQAAPARRPAKRGRPPASAAPRRAPDLRVPVEWYRYNLVDAIDAMEYSLSRLHHLKKDATTMHLRTRSLAEMRTLHKALERSLGTSVSRFKEIRDNLNKEFKQYVAKKVGGGGHLSDDDDVEILHEEDNDDPIFIDENSTESNINESQEVDLTAAGGSSELNDSAERDKNNLQNETEISSDAESFLKRQSESSNHEKQNDTQDDNSECEGGNMVNSANKPNDNKDSVESSETKQNGVNLQESSINQQENIKNSPKPKTVKDEKNEKIDEDILNESSSENDKKNLDSEMSEEMIESLLKDENTGNGEDA